jgi:hypothetical protein
MSKFRCRFELDNEGDWGLICLGVATLLIFLLVFVGDFGYGNDGRFGGDLKSIVGVFLVIYGAFGKSGVLNLILGACTFLIITLG